MKISEFLSFAGVPASIRFDDATLSRDALLGAVPSWPRQSGPASDDAPLAHVTKSSNGYAVGSSKHEPPYQGLSAIGSACALVIDLAFGWLQQHPEYLCLHAGGVELDGRVIVLTGPSRTGKSTMISRLAAAGLVVYGDDMLPIDPSTGEALSLGVSPRLRMPLPPGVAPEFKRFVEKNSGPGDRQYQYIRSKNQAQHGRRAPVGAVVCLHRLPVGPTRFRALDPAEALRLLVLRNLVRNRDPQAILDGLQGLIAGVPCVTLEFSGLEPAARAIQEAFGGWQAGKPKLHPPRPVTLKSFNARRAANVPADQPFQRADHVAVRHVGEVVFLSNPLENIIFHVNPVGGAVWALLATPQSTNAITDALAIAFPDVDRTQIGADVGLLMARMRSEALIVPV